MGDRFDKELYLDHDIIGGDAIEVYYDAPVAVDLRSLSDHDLEIFFQELSDIIAHGDQVDKALAVMPMMMFISYGQIVREQMAHKNAFGNQALEPLIIRQAVHLGQSADLFGGEVPFVVPVIEQGASLADLLRAMRVVQVRRGKFKQQIRIKKVAEKREIPIQTAPGAAAISAGPSPVAGITVQFKEIASILLDTGIAGNEQLKTNSPADISATVIDLVVRDHVAQMGGMVELAKSLIRHLTLVYDHRFHNVLRYAPSNVAHLLPAPAAPATVIVAVARSAPPGALIDAAKRAGFALDISFATNVMATFYALGLLDLYMALAHSVGSTGSAWAMFDLNRATVRMKVAEERVRAERANMLNAFATIAATHFGIIVPRSAATPEAVLALMGRKEQKQAQLLYEKQVAEAKMLAENKCRHRRAVASLHTAKSPESISAALEDVMKYKAPSASPSTASAMIMCVECKLPLICPHTVALAQADIERKNFNEVRLLLAEFIDYIHERDVFYCKICGELLRGSRIYDEHNSTEHADDIDPELSSHIWEEVMTALHRAHIKGIVDMARTIKNIVMMLYPYIAKVEQQIIMSKASVASEIKSKLRINIAIYTYAMLIHLATGPSKMPIEFVGADPNRQSEADLLRHAQAQILSTKNIALRDVPSFTPDKIITDLVKAFKAIRTGPKWELTEDLPDYRQRLMYDPFFGYIFYNTSLSEPFMKEAMLIDKGAGPRNIWIAERAASVMDFGVQEAKTKARAADRKRATSTLGALGAPHKFLIAVAEKNTVFSDKDAERLSKASGGSMRAAREVIAAGGLALMARYAKEELYSKPVYAEAKIPHDFDVSMRIPMTAEHVAFRAVCDLLARAEIGVRAAIKLYYYQGRVHIMSTAPRIRFLGLRAARLYDEQGRPHKWEPIAQPADRHSIPDKKCATCGVVRSEAAAKIDEAKAREAVRMIEIRRGFFRFFETRCPIEGIHTMNAENKCGKCGYFGGMSDMGPEAIAYFDKYLPVFTEFSAMDVEGFESTGRPAAPSGAPTAEAQAAPWSFNFDAVVAVASEFGVPRGEIQCLGAKGGQTLSAIHDGSYIPPEPRTRYDTRIGVLNGYILRLLGEYNSLRNYKRFLRHAPPIVAVVQEKAGMPRDVFEKATAELPELAGIASVAAESYSAAFEAFCVGRKPREIGEFCLQTFCEILMAIRKSKAGAKICSIFADTFLKYILSREAMLLKPERFNAALLQDMREEKIISADEGADIEEIEATEEEEQADDPFSIADFDVDDEDYDYSDESMALVELHIGRDEGW